MKGAKPRLQVIEGTADAGRCPSAPPWLPAAAKAEWKRVAPILHRNGILADDTVTLVESYCVAVGQSREFEAVMAVEGRTIATADGPKVHPVFRAQTAALREARLLAAELGLSPHRRAKGAADSTADPWEGMLG